MLGSGPMRRSPGSARRTQGILGGRSEQVVRRVLAAAIAELARSGYAGLRMDEARREPRSTRPRSIDGGRAVRRWSLRSWNGCGRPFARARCQTPDSSRAISSRPSRGDSPSVERSRAEPGPGCSTTDTAPRSKRSSAPRWTSVARSGSRWSRAASTGVNCRREPMCNSSWISSARSLQRRDHHAEPTPRCLA